MVGLLYRRLCALFGCVLGLRTFQLQRCCLCHSLLFRPNSQHSWELFSLNTFWSSKGHDEEKSNNSIHCVYTVNNFDDSGGSGNLDKRFSAFIFSDSSVCILLVYYKFYTFWPENT